MGKHVALDLSHCIHRDANRNEERRATKIERHGGVGNQKLRQDANGREVDGADDGNAGQDVIDVFGRFLARADAGQEAAVLAQIVGGVLAG